MEWYVKNNYTNTQYRTQKSWADVLCKEEADFYKE